MTHRIAWATRDRAFIREICRKLGVSPTMSINRTTCVGTLTPEQLDWLEPYVKEKKIEIRIFAST